MAEICAGLLRKSGGIFKTIRGSKSIYGSIFGSCRQVLLCVNLNRAHVMAHLLQRAERKGGDRRKHCDAYTVLRRCACGINKVHTP